MGMKPRNGLVQVVNLDGNLYVLTGRAFCGRCRSEFPLNGASRIADTLRDHEKECRK